MVVFSVRRAHTEMPRSHYRQSISQNATIRTFTVHDQVPSASSTYIWHREIVCHARCSALWLVAGSSFHEFRRVVVQKRNSQLLSATSTMAVAVTIERSCLKR